eukprot:101685_1
MKIVYLAPCKHGRVIREAEVLIGDKKKRRSLALRSPCGENGSSLVVSCHKIPLKDAEVLEDLIRDVASKIFYRATLVFQFPLDQHAEMAIFQDMIYPARQAHMVSFGTFRVSIFEDTTKIFLSAAKTAGDEGKILVVPSTYVFKLASVRHVDFAELESCIVPYDGGVFTPQAGTRIVTVKNREAHCALLENFVWA